MKTYIIKDGRTVSDFENEHDAVLWLAGGMGLEVAFEPDDTIEYEYAGSEEEF